MAHNPLVSVIIPAFNAEAFIAQTLNSVLTQTYENIEIWVIDDGSRDQTAAVVEQFIQQDQRVRLLRQANAGVAAARNLGIQKAQGELIAPLDADDLWYPQKLEKQVRCLLEAGPLVGLVYAWSVHIDEQGYLTGGVNTSYWEGEVYLALAYRNFLGHASAPLIRRVCLEQVGGYNCEYKDRHAQGCEDRDLYLRIAERYQFRVVPEFLIGYRQITSSMSNNDTVMARSPHLVWQAVQQRHPEIPAAVYRCSNSNFYVYLAQQTSRRGSYRQTLLWLLRAVRLDLATLLRHQLYTLGSKSLFKLLLQPLTSRIWPDHPAWVVFKQQLRLHSHQPFWSAQIKPWLLLREQLPWKRYEQARLQKWVQAAQLSQPSPLARPKTL
jgi:glycosyltransferase involved in cell wall biosynthesis